MSVSHMRVETPGIGRRDGSGMPRRAAPPPFWELEDLLAEGLGRGAALAVIAARRHWLPAARRQEPATAGNRTRDVSPGHGLHASA
jgi:hypothetical protein